MVNSKRDFLTVLLALWFYWFNWFKRIKLIKPIELNIINFLSLALPSTTGQHPPSPARSQRAGFRGQVGGQVGGQMLLILPNSGACLYILSRSTG